MRSREGRGPRMRVVERSENQWVLSRSKYCSQSRILGPLPLAQPALRSAGDDTIIFPRLFPPPYTSHTGGDTNRPMPSAMNSSRMSLRPVPASLDTLTSSICASILSAIAGGSRNAS